MQWWLVQRYFRTSQGLLSLSTFLSVLGMMIGVGSLVVAMAVVSGFESTLKRSIIDVVGHLVVFVRGGVDSPEKFRELRAMVPEGQAYTPFVLVESILAHQGKITGAMVYGVDEATVHQVINLKKRVREGEFSLLLRDGIPGALIGKGLAKKHQLKVGDVFRIVLPNNLDSGKRESRPKIGRFYVSGVLDLGRHDYDGRYVVSSLKAIQSYAQLGQRISGYRFRLSRDDVAEALAAKIEAHMGERYEATNWRDVNRYLFEAARLEKPVIFFILLIIVVAASFNIASTLFVNVVRRYRDISILKSMGAGQRLIVGIFSLQGLIIGAVGSALGLILGLGACGAFMWAQDRFQLISGEVYKIDKVVVELRWLDLAAILIASLLISLIASLGPALRGAKLPPVEGLRYE